MQENFMKRIKRQPLVSSNGFKRTKYAVERSLFFSELQSIQRLDMSALCVVVVVVPPLCISAICCCCCCCCC